MNPFQKFVSKFVAPQSEVTALPVESATAEVSTEDNKDGTVTVNVRYKLRSEKFTIKAGSSMSELFQLVRAKFSLGSLDTVAVLNESNNEVATYQQVANQPIVSDTNISVEESSGTAG